MPYRCPPRRNPPRRTPASRQGEKGDSIPRRLLYPPDGPNCFPSPPTFSFVLPVLAPAAGGSETGFLGNSRQRLPDTPPFVPTSFARFPTRFPLVSCPRPPVVRVRPRSHAGEHNGRDSNKVKGASPPRPCFLHSSRGYAEGAWSRVCPALPFPFFGASHRIFLPPLSLPFGSVWHVLCTTPAESPRLSPACTLLRSHC